MLSSFKLRSVNKVLIRRVGGIAYTQIVTRPEPVIGDGKELIVYQAIVEGTSSHHEESIAHKQKRLYSSVLELVVEKG